MRRRLHFFAAGNQTPRRHLLGWSYWLHLPAGDGRKTVLGGGSEEGEIAS